MVKKIKTTNLPLTSQELTHIRDLMTILLPPDGRLTVSKSLALCENRAMVEGKLWNKVFEQCIDTGVPISEESPDFCIGLEYGEPKMMVVPINIQRDLDESNEEDSQEDFEPEDEPEEEIVEKKKKRGRN